MFSEDATRILRQRYFIKDTNGKVIEDAEGMLKRVAKAVAAPERENSDWEERFYSIMANKRFLPNSPTLANAGRTKGQLAACFVLPVPDSLDGIFETMKKAAVIHKTGGGTGFSFSKIRPDGDTVSTTGGLASGPIPFIKAFNCATDAVKQGGMRRGANMAVLNCRHPDIYEFTNMKKREGSLSNFNISVGVDHEFMSKVISGGYIDFINPRTGKAFGKSLRASDLFDVIVEAAWEKGEPGILFFDNMNKANTLPGLGELNATNPCGEQPLYDYECCNLGSLNLTSYFIEGEGDYRSKINWALLKDDIDTAVRFLDNVVDVNYYVYPEIEKISTGNRKIGLGVMGFADLLISLGVSYASETAVEIAGTIMKFIQENAHVTSAKLAMEKGSFPNIGLSIFKGNDIRNATVTTIAPTGTLAMLADVSSGIEPLFGLNYVREALEGGRFSIVNKAFEKIAKKAGFWSRSLMDEIAEKNSLVDIKGIPEEVKKLFVTSYDIQPEQHIKVQAMFQKYVDNAVSKTINFPNNATKEEVKASYLTAWKYGCKGITVYRTGSRSKQIVMSGGAEVYNSRREGECEVCIN